MCCGLLWACGQVSFVDVPVAAMLGVLVGALFICLQLVEVSLLEPEDSCYTHPPFQQP